MSIFNRLPRVTDWNPSDSPRERAIAMLRDMLDNEGAIDLLTANTYKEAVEDLHSQGEIVRIINAWVRPEDTKPEHIIR